MHLFAATTSVANCPAESNVSAAIKAQLCDTTLPQVTADNGTITIVLQFVFGLVGVLAVFFFIFSGLKFITSQGDPQGISKARRGIIYAAIGLAVAVSAEAIVTWVLGRL
jgi:hypothetical protein